MNMARIGPQIMPVTTKRNGTQAIGGIGLNNSTIGLPTIPANFEKPMIRPIGTATARASTNPITNLLRLAMNRIPHGDA